MIILRKVQARSFDNHSLRRQHTTMLVAWPSTVHAIHRALANVVASHGIKHHKYADDMQIYITSAKNEFSNGFSILQECSNDIYAWLTNNGLALNLSKSEEIVLQGQRCTENVVKDVKSIVRSCLDYCNSPWLGMSESNFDQLQRVQNTLARVVTSHTKFDHITPMVAELH